MNSINGKIVAGNSDAKTVTIESESLWGVSGAVISQRVLVIPLNPDWGYLSEMGYLSKRLQELQAIRDREEGKKK